MRPPNRSPALLPLAITGSVLLFLAGCADQQPAGLSESEDLSVTAAAHRKGSTYTVNSNDDTDDGTCSPAHCSLREAINAANAGSGSDLIAFNIPGSGVHTIQPLSQLPTITGPVTMDGYTQPGAKRSTSPRHRGSNASLMIELDGTLAGSSASGLRIVSSGSLIRGLAINRFREGILIEWPSATHNVIEGNFIGTGVAGATGLGNVSGVLIRFGAKNNTVGGTQPAASNLISGNAGIGAYVFGTGTEQNQVLGNLLGTDATGTARIPNFNGVQISGGAAQNEVGGVAGGSGNLISGNRRDGVAFYSGATGNQVLGNLIGTDISGSADLGNGVNGIIVSSGGQIIGGTHPRAGNVVSGNDFAGVNIFTSSNTVQGNLVGTDVSGRQAIPNRVVGVTVQHGAAYNLVGGLEPNARNTISGNGHGGLEGGLTLTWSATDNLVQGNYIGTDVTGKRPLANQGPGLYIAASASDNVIGGTEHRAGNRIAFNTDRGFKVHSWGTNAFLGNSIHSNGLLGIDLRVNGVTDNDPGDLDVGPNGLQNFPELIAVTKGSVQGTLNSTPNTTFRLEFFASDECDPSGYGEGRIFLGGTDVTTDGNGDVAFEFRPGDIQNPGTSAGIVPRVLTATATDPSGNTSEFSACVARS